MQLNTEKLFDLSLVEKICRGNNAVRNKMIKTFIDTTLPSLEEIKNAHKNEDIETIRKTAHRIKPVLAIYAIVKIEREIRQLEKADREPLNNYDLGLIIEKIDAVLNNVVLELKKDFFVN